MQSLHTSLFLACRHLSYSHLEHNLPKVLVPVAIEILSTVSVDFLCYHSNWTIS